MKKRTILALALCLLFSVTAGCQQETGGDNKPTATEDRSLEYPPLPMTDADFETLLQNANSFEIWHFAYNSDEILSCTTIAGKPHSYVGVERIYATSAKEDLNTVRNCFDGWSLSENQVPYNKMTLTALSVIIVFDNGLVFQCKDGHQNDGYGELVDISLFYLPAAFYDYVLNKLDAT